MSSVFTDGDYTTYVSLTEGQIRQIPQRLRFNVTSVYEFMLLGNETNCKLLESITGETLEDHLVDTFSVSLEEK